MAKNGIYPLIERVFDDYNLIQPMLFDPVYNNANEMYTSTQEKFNSFKDRLNRVFTCLCESFFIISELSDNGRLNPPLNAAS